MKFYGRRYKLTVGTLEVSALDIKFQVTKSTKPQPNTCEVQIWNLSAEHRAQLATPKALPMRLEAGYKEGMAIIYLGEVRSLVSMVEGSDIITKFSTGDSEKEMQNARLNVPIGAGAGPDQVMQLLVQGLGVSPGNVQQAVAKLRARGSAEVYGKRGVISNHVAQELTDLCRSAGLEWSVQDGKMQILDLNKPLDGQAFVLSADTGLVGSPTVDMKGIVEATCFLMPLLNPGRMVMFDAVNLKGGYKVIHVEYTGDSKGNDWYAKITGKKVI